MFSQNLSRVNNIVGISAGGRIISLQHKERKGVAGAKLKRELWDVMFEKIIISESKKREKKSNNFVFKSSRKICVIPK